MNLPENSQKLMDTGLTFFGMLGVKVRIVTKKARMNNHLGKVDR
jgi:hypothetical protein